MNKILFSLFLLLILFFPKPEAFALSACAPGAPIGPLQKSGVAKADECATDTCFKTNATSGFDCYSKTPAPTRACTTSEESTAATSTVTDRSLCPINTCYVVTAAGADCHSLIPAAPASVDPCIANPDKCTGGRGLQCFISSGAIAKRGEKGDGIMTAIGCVPTEPQKLVEGLLKYGTFASGGIAFLMMILGAIQMITAEGNPESIKHAQERFYSAIIGLLLIIFAVLLMQVIGVDILGLPDFGK